MPEKVRSDGKHGRVESAEPIIAKGKCNLLHENAPLYRETTLAVGPICAYGGTDDHFGDITSMSRPSIAEDVFPKCVCYMETPLFIARQLFLPWRLYAHMVVQTITLVALLRSVGPV